VAITGAATVADLRDKGIEFRGEPEERDYGIQATLVLAGGLEVGLYEPRHEPAV